MNNRAQFFIVSAVVIAICLVYIFWYAVEMKMAGESTLYYQDMETYQLFENLKQECKDIVDLSLEENSNLSENLEKFKVFAEKSMRQLNHRLKLDYIILNNNVFFEISLETNGISLKDEFWYNSSKRFSE